MKKQNKYGVCTTCKDIILSCMLQEKESGKWVRLSDILSENEIQKLSREKNG